MIYGKFEEYKGSGGRVQEEAKYKSYETREVEDMEKKHDFRRGELPEKYCKDVVWMG